MDTTPTQTQLDAEAYLTAKAKQHAPGPWELITVTCGDGSRCLAIKSTKTGGVVGYPEGGSAGEMEANAALQVLGPQMLEACKFVLEKAFEHKWAGDERAFSMLSRIVKAAQPA